MIPDNEILSIIISELYNKQAEYGTQIKMAILKPNNITLDKNHFEIIIKKLKQTSFVEETQSVSAEDYSFCISIDGVIMLDKYKSYLKYLEAEHKKSHREEQGKTNEINRKNISLIITIISTGAAITFGINNISKNIEIEKKDKIILELTNKLNKDQPPSINPIPPKTNKK